MAAILSTALSIGVPLAEELIPKVTPYVVKLVDKIFGNGNGDTAKLPAAKGIINAILANYPTNPAVTPPPAPPPPPDAVDPIVTVIKSVVAELNSEGKLKGTATVLEDITGIPPAALFGALQVLQGLVSMVNSVVDEHKAPAATTQT
jgi:hypothetical protein